MRRKKNKNAKKIWFRHLSEQLKTMVFGSDSWAHAKRKSLHSSHLLKLVLKKKYSHRVKHRAKGFVLFRFICIYLFFFVDPRTCFRNGQTVWVRSFDSLFLVFEEEEQKTVFGSWKMEINIQCFYGQMWKHEKKKWNQFAWGLLSHWWNYMKMFWTCKCQTKPRLILQRKFI